MSPARRIPNPSPQVRPNTPLSLTREFQTHTTNHNVTHYDLPDAITMVESCSESTTTSHQQQEVIGTSDFWQNNMDLSSGTGLFSPIFDSTPTHTDDPLSSFDSSSGSSDFSHFRPPPLSPPPIPSDHSMFDFLNSTSNTESASLEDQASLSISPSLISPLYSMSMSTSPDVESPPISAAFNKPWLSDLSSRSGSLPVDPSDSKAMKRLRNTVAARQRREKKRLELDEMRRKVEQKNMLLEEMKGLLREKDVVLAYLKKRVEDSEMLSYLK